CLFMTVSVFFQAEDGIRHRNVTGVQTCALPISENYENSHTSRPLSRMTERVIATICSMCGLMRTFGPPTVTAAARVEAILRPTAKAETSATVSPILSP